MEMMNDQEPPARGSIQAKDPFSKAPPGYSLTRVNSQWNWGKPPLDVDPEVVLDKAIRSLNKPSVRWSIYRSYDRRLHPSRIPRW